MTPSEFSKYFAQAKVEIKRAMDNNLPRIVGNKAASLFRKNFQTESFFGKKWQEVKRRQNPKVKGADAHRKILTGRTANLGRSLQVTTATAKAVITSDLPYSAAHNEGTSNGYESTRKMPFSYHFMILLPLQPICFCSTFGSYSALTTYFCRFLPFSLLPRRGR